MAEHVLDLAAFRLAFTAFNSAVKYPDVYIQRWWGIGTGFIYAYDSCVLEGVTLQSALELMTAHLLALAGAADGTVAPVTPASVKGSQVDKVRVELQTAPAKSAWSFWLSTTPYGLQLWALLTMAAAGGFYVGGLPERRGFRRVYGGFGG